MESKKMKNWKMEIMENEKIENQKKLKLWKIEYRKM